MTRFENTAIYFQTNCEKLKIYKFTVDKNDLSLYNAESVKQVSNIEEREVKSCDYCLQF
jgi:hypothetical protein